MFPPRFVPRDTHAHKGQFGRAVIIGGSRGMAGAPSLAGRSALRSGSGLVTVAVPDESLPIVAGHSLCYMTQPLPSDSEGRIGPGSDSALHSLLDSAGSIGLGPGMGRSEYLIDLVTQIYARYSGPLVVDADGLNALAAGTVPDNPAGPRVLTPHIGEFRRLVGDPQLTADECRQRAPELAERTNSIVVVKGPRSLVTDGTQSIENETGNPGMATGGAGDVLTGVVTSLLGQMSSAFEAVCAAVYVHGLAGDLARNRFGERSMTAEDIVDHLSDAFQRLTTS